MTNRASCGDCVFALWANAREGACYFNPPTLQVVPTQVRDPNNLGQVRVVPQMSSCNPPIHKDRPACGQFKAAVTQ